MLGHRVELETVAIKATEQGEGMGNILNMNRFRIWFEGIEEVSRIGLYGHDMMFPSSGGNAPTKAAN
ncbi:MAG: hypothetical protein GY779_05180 [Gammaproteobacteria bacterium]|nr:hypothetical protein [Gammaproteobacteria bacterium]